MSPPSAHRASAASHALSPVHSGIPEENCLETLLIAWVAPDKLHRGDRVSNVIWGNKKSVFIFLFGQKEKEGTVFSVLGVAWDRENPRPHQLFTSFFFCLFPSLFSPPAPASLSFYSLHSGQLNAEPCILLHISSAIITCNLLTS